MRNFFDLLLLHVLTLSYLRKSTNPNVYQIKKSSILRWFLFFLVCSMAYLVIKDLFLYKEKKIDKP